MPNLDDAARMLAAPAQAPYDPAKSPLVKELYRAYARLSGDRLDFTALGLDEAFRQMEAAGFIRALKTERRGLDGLSLSFLYASSAEQPGDDKTFRNLNYFFTRRLLFAQEPFRCRQGTDAAGTPVFHLESGSLVSINDWTAPDFPDKRQMYPGGWKRFPYAGVFPALHRLYRRRRGYNE